MVDWLSTDGNLKNKKYILPILYLFYIFLINIFYDAMNKGFKISIDK